MCPVKILKIENGAMIEASKRRVPRDEATQCKKRYQNYTKFNCIIRELSNRVGKTVDELYSVFAWKLYMQCGHNLTLSFLSPFIPVQYTHRSSNRVIYHFPYN